MHSLSWKKSYRCQEGASRGGFTLSNFPKVCLSRLRRIFVAIACEAGMSALGQKRTSDCSTPRSASQVRADTSDRMAATPIGLQVARHGA